MALGFSVPGILGKKTFSSMNYRASNRCFTPFTPNSKIQRKFQIPREKITPDDDGCDVFYMVIALEFVVEMMIL